MITQDTSKAAALVAEREKLRRELLRLILKNEAQRKTHAKNRIG